MLGSENMFTGIVEEIGTILSVKKGVKSSALTISGDLIFEDMHIGDSIAVNGVCLTVTNKTKESFTADVMAETLRRSSLGSLKAGSKVNLERAMAANGRFGGHIVSGHIDGTGEIESFVREDIVLCKLFLIRVYYNVHTHGIVLLFYLFIQSKCSVLQRKLRNLILYNVANSSKSCHSSQCWNRILNK